MQRGQGALEYMLLIGGAVLVAAIVIVIVIASGSSAQCKPEKTVLKTQLVTTAAAYWGFDEGTGSIAKDLTVNANHGTLKNGVQWQTSGCVSGSCLKFGGTPEYVLAGYLPVFNKKSFSVELWAKFDDDDGADKGLVTSADAGAPDRYLHITRRQVKPYFGFYYDDLWGNKTLSLGKWWHLVFTWDASTKARKIYVNANLDASDTSSGLLEITSGAVTENGIRLGRNEGGFFNGYMDEVRIYNRVLGEDEIKEHYSKENCS